MTTRDALVDEVLLNLAGYLTDQELIGSLVTPVGTGDATFTVSGSVFPDGVGFQPGIAELGAGELVYVGAVAAGSGVFSSVVRGFRSTTATSWAAGTQVRANPRVPRMSIVREFNHVLRGLYPKVFKAVTVEVAVVDGVAAYDLPADCGDVLSVQVSDAAQPSVHKRSRYWSFLPDAPSSSATGKVLLLRDAWGGATATVTYTAEPGLFADTPAGDAEFTTATGLPAYCQDLVVAGAGYRVCSWLQVGMGATRTAEGDLMAGQPTMPDLGKTTQLLYALYNERLVEAQLRLRRDFDAGTVHYTG